MIDKGEISDGYHTFNELYAHRDNLFILCCYHLRFNVENRIWKSKKHSDGSMYEGYFILGVTGKGIKPISYHLPMTLWDKCPFAEELLLALPWDGHTSEDVLERIKEYYLYSAQY